MDFGEAIKALKEGYAVAREGWNGKEQFVYLVGANSYPAQTGVAKAFFGPGAMVPYNAYLAIKTQDGTVSTWAPSGSDALAEDWCCLSIHSSMGAIPMKPVGIVTEFPPAEPVKSIPPHMERVMFERLELDDKLSKLGLFINGRTYAGLPSQDRLLLRSQYSAMQAYLGILDLRIEAAMKTDDGK